MNIPILYEDDWLMIVDKPSGLIVIPTPKKEKRTLTSILNDYAKDKNLAYGLHPCHRLDRETSGLIIYAKGKSLQKKMMDAFKQKAIKKAYVAFLQGALPSNNGVIKNRIEGRSAVTEYRVIQSNRDFSVVEAFPLTGRTNQLRIHFKQIGHPVVGETKFAFRRDFSLGAKRLCLHASRLEFMHPVTKEKISLSCELPVYLKEFLSK